MVGWMCFTRKPQHLQNVASRPTSQLPVSRPVQSAAVRFASGGHSCTVVYSGWLQPYAPTACLSVAPIRPLMLAWCHVLLPRSPCDCPTAAQPETALPRHSPARSCPGTLPSSYKLFKGYEALKIAYRPFTWNYCLVSRDTPSTCCPKHP